MRTDPLLADPAFLAIAAWRAQKRREAASTQPPDWRFTTGLASLLESARGLPQRDPWTLPDVQDCRGLERLLAEARAREKEHGRGT